MASAAPPPQQQQPPDAGNERRVVDPVAHLPVVIHDVTDSELDGLANRPLPAPRTHSAQSVLRDAMSNVVHEEAQSERWQDLGAGKANMQVAMFTALAVGLGSTVTLWFFCLFGKGWPYGWADLFRASALCSLVAILSGVAIFYIPHPALQQEPHSEHTEQSPTSTESPEPAVWLNAFIGTLWPIVNPTLFISISDMLEDVLQSSLPKVIKAVKVADLGQGAEPLRILGIRSLQPSEINENSDQDDGSDSSNVVRLELAVAYRAQATNGAAASIKSKAQNAHILIKFWIAGGIELPVWVELSGLIATFRVKLSLTPNPPFLSMMTLALLGQPKLALKCTPLSQKFFNVMDIPGLSGWLHQSINSAISFYVAPRSLSLDIGTLLAGAEKTDSDALGIIFVTIKSAKGYKDGDGLPSNDKNKDGSAQRKGDVYVTVGWGKWGKPLWSTRILENKKGLGELAIWEESTFLLVTPTDINAEEKLRLQLWDSDRFTADDHLGMVDLPLKDIMSTTPTNQVSTRDDGFVSTSGKNLPGTLSWSFAYYEKTTVDQQLKKPLPTPPEEQPENRPRSKPHADDPPPDIASFPPSPAYPTGILYFRIDEITGLEVPNVRESGVSKANANGKAAEDEENDDLPSAYCEVIINHQRVYKTRSKMKNAKPYFNAGSERVIKDWQSTLVMITVRDNRLHETDPLIGVLILPLAKLFASSNRSQVSDTLPLVGGIGYGRVRFMIGFRSVQAQLPKEVIGWDVGTLELGPKMQVKAKQDATKNLLGDMGKCKIVVRAHPKVGRKVKLSPQSPDNGSLTFAAKKDKPAHIAITKRYSTSIVISFEKKVLGPDPVPFFAILWLKDIPDNASQTITLPVFPNSSKLLDMAQDNPSFGGEAQKVGDLVLEGVKFWPGLSGYHGESSATKNQFASVMDALDCAQEAEENRVGEEAPYISSTSSSDSSSSSSDSSDSEGGDGGGLIPGLKKKHRAELHRKHRGLMQWSTMRQAAWIGKGVENKADDVKRKFASFGKHEGPKGLQGVVEKEA